MFIVHILSLIFVGIIITYTDHGAFQWFCGKKELLNVKMIRRSSFLVWVGLFLIIVSGIFLFYPARNFLLQSPIFILKMIFIGILFANGIAITKLSPIASQKPYKTLTNREKLPLLISSTLSVIGWIGATITAFFIFD